MKYCLKWTNLCKHLKDADEITIKYIEDRGLVDFLQKHANKRINLSIQVDNFLEGEINKLSAIRKQYPELKFSVALDKYYQPLMATLRDREIDFYIITPCQDWETFWQLAVNDRVSDINLSGALAFELTKVKRCLEKMNLNTRIRVTPNIIQSQTPYTHPLQNFFIRPEDIDLYEPYIDVIEFEGLEHQDTFFEIYSKQKIFIGNLNQVIYNFKYSIDNIGLTTHFGERRIDCGRECLYGGRCQRCFTLAEIAQKMGPEMREKIKENLQKQVEENNNATN